MKIDSVQEKQKNERLVYTKLNLLVAIYFIIKLIVEIVD